MDIKWLKTFLVAAEYENFRKAAEVLFLAQPTITVHIKQLELAVGVKLFEKKGRQVKLTTAGRKFIPYAQEVVHRLESGISALESWRQGYQHKLVLAVSPSIAASILPSLLRRFLQHHSTIEVEVHVTESQDILSTLLEGKADLGLSRSPAKHAEICCFHFHQEPVIMVASHDGGESENVPPLDADHLLEQHTVLTHNHPGYWEELLLQLKQRYPKVKTMAVTQAHITKRFIEEGLGLSFLPFSAVKRELLEGRLLEVDPPFPLPSVHSYLISHFEREEALWFKAFLSSLYHLSKYKENLVKSSF